jgi:glycosyltransferase involved in cell wall biosynthesis
VSKFLFLSAKIPTRNPNLEDFLDRQLAYFSNYWSLSQRGEVWFVGLNGFIKLKKEENSAEVKVEIFSGFKCLSETRVMLRKLDLISSQSPWIDGAFSLILGKILNVKVIVQMHFDPKLVENKLLKKYFMKTVLCLSSYVRLVSISQSSFTKGLVNKSRVIPVPCVMPNTKELKLDQPKIYDLIFFGRLHQEKGISKLIEVIEELGSHTDISLLIVGDGPMRDEILSALRLQNTEGNIKLLPWTSRNTLFELIQQSRLHLNLSPTESYGLSFIEAAACQTPSLATPTSGAKEIAKVVGSIQFITNLEARKIVREISSILTDTTKLVDLNRKIPSFELLENKFANFMSWPEYIRQVISQD